MKNYGMFVTLWIIVILFYFFMLYYLFIFLLTSDFKLYSLLKLETHFRNFIKMCVFKYLKYETWLFHLIYG